ncbi:MAG: aminotransferase class III-fold pyridoxal phosphate-dependent enzyme [Helicobacteraceae bacterium]|jgi:acetylornithine aminotransferase|nr:aminotransferase class III-fold pyridoxal phosphate-dependent enzyme [Helicobacteraceae bacterium]
MTLKELDDQYVLHTYARRQIAFERGQNARAFDENRNDYIDFTSGIGVNSIGHNNPRLVCAIAEQAGRILHGSNLYLNRNQAELAQTIARLSGMNTRTFFANSGAEANECAIKIARKYGEKSGRYKIITLKNSFHGRTIAALKATAQDKFHEHFGPFPDGFAYADDLDDALKLIDGRTIGVMVEIVQGEGGVVPMNKEKIKKLAARLKKDRLLLIADEIQCGVYRCGEFLASQIYGVEPDIFTLAKGLGGGVPIGAAATTLKEVFIYGDHGSTFGGNFLAAKAALVTLDVLERLQASGELQKTIDYFGDRCRAIALNFPNLFVGVTGIGLMKALIARDEQTRGAIIDAAHANRLLALRAGETHIRLLPPLTVTKEEINEGFARFESACRLVK